MSKFRSASEWDQLLEKKLAVLATRMGSENHAHARGRANMQGGISSHGGRAPQRGSSHRAAGARAQSSDARSTKRRQSGASPPKLRFTYKNHGRGMRLAPRESWSMP